VRSIKHESDWGSWVAAQNGNTAYLLQETLKVLEKELESEITFLKDYEIKSCEGCQYPSAAVVSYVTTSFISSFSLS